jgi:hypothetical protein
MSKQTAVDDIFNDIEQKLQGERETLLYFLRYKKLWKNLEKNQIKEAFEIGIAEGAHRALNNSKKMHCWAEYYQETYGVDDE